MRTHEQFTIIGAGIAGLTTAIALRQIGLQPTIFEAAPTIKALGAGLGLAANAVKALQKLGIAEAILSAGRFLDAFTILDQQGRIITRTDSKRISQKYGIDNFTIHRGALHRELLNQVADTPIITSKRATRVSKEGQRSILHFDDGTEHSTDYLIVADGIHSPIRQQLVPDSHPRYAGYTCWRSVIDSTGLDITAATETWGINGRIGMAPLADNLLYWFACVNAQPNDPKMRQFRTSDLLRLFGDYHEPIPQVLARVKNENLLWNDIFDLKPIPRYAFDNIVLVGDAAHATTPNMGQGACQAIEDAVVLADELNKGGLASDAFKRFEQRRLKRTHYITDRSRQIGQVAQTQRPIVAWLRNSVFRLLPPSMNESQLKQIYEVDF
ncbi:FAD-dependent monooxygenase [Spirosoma sp. BT702]|uniref:FAD-dependent monooxygenase n=1 Tax=Spirosoma profusum TaxID=2771354 RepID=A0A927AQX1_9BACT|nr:FAD-dependent monooxygenase [Spirosoma profusum]MBD2701306.1 FAD-dependent monooxygenase [Spirosoma profusum]